MGLLTPNISHKTIITLRRRHQPSCIYYRATIFSKMLRRAPTAISLTQEDLEQYEQRRQQHLLEQRASRTAARSLEAGERSQTQTSQGGKTKEQRIMGI
jgi:hypothetical protein